MLKFIITDSTAQSQKRKQSPRACEDCRRKKKRCRHADDMRQVKKSFVPQASYSLEGHPLATVKRVSGSGQPEGLGDDRSLSQEFSGAPSKLHFTQDSDILPNSHITQFSPAATSQRSHHGDQRTCVGSNSRPNTDPYDCRFIGDLSPEAVFLAATSPNTSTGVAGSEDIGIWLAEKGGRDHDVTTSTTDPRQLNPFYLLAPSLSKIMIPLLTKECLSLLPVPSELEALSSIYFEKHHPILPVLDRQSFQNMNPTDPARILLTQGICLVASLNSNSKSHLRLQNSSNTLTPRNFGQQIAAAMKTSIELGLVTQMNVLIQAFCLLSSFSDGPDGGEQSSQLCGRAVHLIHSMELHLSSLRHGHDSQYQETLLCCVWALDRLNAATHGRPVLMHERDVGKDLKLCLENQSPTFQLFLRVISLLDRVIDLYRPKISQATAWEGDFPMLEDLLSYCRETHIPTVLLATMEILYHAVAILSCRSKLLEDVQLSPTSYVRQSLSATQITSSVEGEFRDHLSWFPFVPYAISLALSVAYRDMRYRKIPMYRTRARAQLVKNCGALEYFGEHFWFASKMAEMGNLTLQEMDKVYSKVARSRRSMINSGDLNMTEVVETAKFSPISDTVEPSRSANGNHSIANEAYFEQPDIDPTLPVDLLDLDVFALFDSTFDLNTIDAYMGGNLDLSFPATFS